MKQSAAKALLRNKLGKAGDVILCDNKAKNAGIAIAMTRLFNAISVQKNKTEWSSYFVTMPKFGEEKWEEIGETIEKYIAKPKIQENYRRLPHEILNWGS